ncbi:MAG: glycosyltransferase family 39 protein [Kiritimatiellales bacterium]
MKNSFRFLKSGLLVIAVILVCRLLSLPLYPLVEPSEARYAAISTHMAFSGDYTVPWIWVDGCLVPFLGKPPLFFWAQAISIFLFGINEFAARLPCLLFGALSIGAMIILLRRFAGNFIPVFAGVITASSVLFLVMAGTVAVDMALVFGVTLASCAYYCWLKSESRRVMYGFSLLVFAGLAITVLAKGLIGIALFGLPVFLWHLIFGEWKRVFFRHAWLGGTLLFALLTLPWFVSVHRALYAMDPSFDFLHYFFVEEHFHRFVSEDYTDLYGNGRVKPRGASILFMFIATLPWSFIPLFWLFNRRPKRLCGRHSCLPCADRNVCTTSVTKNLLWANRDEVFFLLLWLVPVLFFAFARQILITYLLPVIPAFGIWMALMIHARQNGEARSLTIYKTAAGLSAGVFLAIVLLSPFLPVIFYKMNTKKIIAETLRDTPDAEIVVAMKGRFYSPYFYAYRNLYSGPHPATCLVKSNQNTFFSLPCAQKMPTRISTDRIQDLKTYTESVTNTTVRVIIRTENFDHCLPETGARRFSDSCYFRFIPSGDRCRLEYCGPNNAEYERLYTEGIFSVIRPIPQSERKAKANP